MKNSDTKGRRPKTEPRPTHKPAPAHAVVERAEPEIPAAIISRRAAGRLGRLNAEVALKQSVDGRFGDRPTEQISLRLRDCA